MRNKRLIILLSIVASLVLIIVVCGATFLVRHVEAYSYYQSSPEEYDKKVIDASGIKSNSSMFFIDEVGVKERIEKQFYNVGVINIERKFPDRVSINYVVYGNSFQYLTSDGYAQCYSSGRIGSTSSAPIGGFFTVKPRDAVAKEPGEYFQDKNGYDRRLVERFIAYLRSTALDDRQIAERISFIDLSRDGYFYIRTRAGCSVEIKGTGEEFASLLDDGWSTFVDPSSDHVISKASGTIRAERVSLDPDAPKNRVTYSAEKGDEYYKENYIKVSSAQA